MAMREYRKGNWTVEETMILIEAKKKDDERRKHHLITRSKQSSSSPSSSGSGSSSMIKPVTELRWKWVEEYCWGKSCFRSQNQCNDKWDNLMRDFKKIRDFIHKIDNNNNNNNNNNNKSYWSMDKLERKEQGLPTNMLPQIYQALFDVVDGGAAGVTTTSFLLPPPFPVPTLQVLSQSPSPAPSPLPASSGFVSPQQVSTAQASPALEAGTSEQHSHDPESSPSKRRRKEGGGGNGGGGSGGGNGGGGSGGGNVGGGAGTTAMPGAATMTVGGEDEEVSRAIYKSARILSEAIQASDEKQERRHKEIMKMHESRLRIEESNLQINTQRLHALTDAINTLSTSIFTWSNSHNKNQQGP